MRILGLAVGAALAAPAADAAGDALVIGNAEVSTLETVLGSEPVAEAADALRAVGFSVTGIEAADGARLAEGLAWFVAGVEPGDAPLVAVLTGTLLHAPGGAWLLPAGDTPGAAQAMTAGLPLDAVMAVLASAPGRAMLVLGEDEAPGSVPRFLAEGPGALDIPQGVTVVRGPAQAALRFAARSLPQADRPYAAAADRLGLTVEGYAPQGHVILRSEDMPDEAATAPEAAPQQPAAPAPDPAAQSAADDAAWRLAQEADSADGYRAYLDGFPEGRHAPAARQRLTAIANDPFYDARRAEDRLNLDRAARQAIQRDLSILGFDTRGIDGIFGPGTRGAIQSWQEGTGMTPSGFLTATQIAALREDAEARAEELEEEARLRAEERARADEALWQETVTVGSEAALRTYLDRFPEGLHAEEARRLISELEEGRAREAAEADRRAWEATRQEGTVEAFQRYLESRPQGAFAAEARDRIAALTGARADAEAAAREDALDLGPVGRQLAEARLARLGLDPGAIDGRFDEATRRAIRRYQRDRGLGVTGYLDEDTVIRLLAGALVRP